MKVDIDSSDSNKVEKGKQLAADIESDSSTCQPEDMHVWVPDDGPIRLKLDRHTFGQFAVIPDGWDVDSIHQLTGHTYVVVEKED